MRPGVGLANVLAKEDGDRRYRELVDALLGIADRTRDRSGLEGWSADALGVALGSADRLGARVGSWPST